MEGPDSGPSSLYPDIPKVPAAAGFFFITIFRKTRCVSLCILRAKSPLPGFFHSIRTSFPLILSSAYSADYLTAKTDYI